MTEPAGNYLTWAQAQPLFARFVKFTEPLNHREMAWFQSAWEHMGRAGLLEFSSELGKSRVVVRCLTLGQMYLDFFRVANKQFGELLARDIADRPYEDLIVACLSVQQLAELLGPDHPLKREQFGHSHEFAETALRRLMNEDRPTIFRALRDGYGDTYELCAVLWGAANPDQPAPVKEDPFLLWGEEKLPFAFVVEVIEFKWY